MLRYYITDRKAAGGIEALVRNIEAAAAAGVDYIQIREKDLSARELLQLTRRAVAAVRPFRTRVLVNSRADIAIAGGAHGVHLPANSIAPCELSPLLGTDRLVAVSCHTTTELQRAERDGATFAVFSPIFASPGKGPAIGLEALKAACVAVTIPVLALGGVTTENAKLCVINGAAGVAGIRLFQQT